MCPVGRDSSSEPEDAARGHAGQTPSEDHQVSPAAQVGPAEHPGLPSTANTQRHGEKHSKLPVRVWVFFPLGSQWPHPL